MPGEDLKAGKLSQYISFYGLKQDRQHGVVDWLFAGYSLLCVWAPSSAMLFFAPRSNLYGLPTGFGQCGTMVRGWRPEEQSSSCTCSSCLLPTSLWLCPLMSLWAYGFCQLVPLPSFSSLQALLTPPFHPYPFTSRVAIPSCFCWPLNVSSP